MPASLAEVLASRMEPLEPQQTIVKVLEHYEGHPIKSDNYIRTIREHCKRSDIRREVRAFHTWITWGNVNAIDGALPLGRHDGKINTAFTLDNSRDLFDGRRQRNALRRQAINAPNNPQLLSLEQKLLQYKQLTIDLQRAFSYGNDWHQDKNAILDAYGLKLAGLSEYPF